MLTGNAGIRGSKILIVDDTPQNIDVLRKFLALEGYRLSFATNGKKALEIVSRAQPDLILLDVMMPGMDGFETCRILKSKQETQNIPVIFLTALSDSHDKVKGFGLGAVDYITKPLQYEEVLARVANHLKLQTAADELRRHSQESEQARHEAEMANRAKTTFLAKMSHELRTPLNAILGYSDLIQDEASELGYEDIIPDLARIQTAANHLLHTISNVLDLAKIEAEKIDITLQPVDIAAMLREVEAVISPIFIKGDNQFSTFCPSGIGSVLADSAKLKQSLFNLLSNACKYTTHGTISLSVSRDGEWVNFAVKDSGIGIPPNRHEHIFQPFQQADDANTREFDGTGLGLPIAKAYCTMMGGRIHLESAPGQGSTFTIQIPANSGDNGDTSE